MKRYFSAILFVLLVMGCVTEEPANAPDLVGTWEPTYMLLEDVNAAEDDPMAGTLLLTPDNWVKIAGIKPIRITYSPDGTFMQEHRDKNDSLFLTSRGVWHTAGDSLYWFQNDPDTFKLTLHWEVAADTLKLEGIVDYDRDGIVNDKLMLYQMRMP